MARRRFSARLLAAATWLSGLAILTTNLSVRVQACCGDSLSYDKRGITVADSVEISTLDSPADIYAGQPAPYFSPDGKHFVVVVRKANIEQDTNDSSVLLYETREALSSPKTDVLLKMSSSSSERYSIRQIRWLPDNETLVFLGEILANPRKCTNSTFVLEFCEGGPTIQRPSRITTLPETEVYSRT